MQQISPCKIRHATVSDLELLLDLGVRTFNETFAHLNRAEDMEAYLSAAFNPDQIAAEITDPLSTFFIAESNGAGVGYAKLHCAKAPDCVTPSRPVELARLYVVREMHGHRVGGTMMHRMLEEARRNGFRTMWLGVWEHNERAKAFYSNWKFQTVGSHVFQLGSDPQIDLLMERAI